GVRRLLVVQLGDEGAPGSYNGRFFHTRLEWKGARKDSERMENLVVGWAMGDGRWETTACRSDRIRSAVAVVAHPPSAIQLREASDLERRRANRVERALGAARFPCLAYPAAVPDQQMREHGPAVRRVEIHQDALDLFRIGLAR